MNIKIVSWNVLGHKHTHYNYKHHKNGFQNIESDKQLQNRKYKNTNILNEINPDILLLQEFSGCEIDVSNYINTENYVYNKDPECYIFYKEDKIKLSWSRSICIKYNKNAVIAEFIELKSLKKFIVISIHLVGGKNSRMFQHEQINIIESIINNINIPIIMGGDFNQPNIHFLNNISKYIMFIDSDDNTAVVNNMTIPGKLDYFGTNLLCKNNFNFHGVFIHPVANPWSINSIVGSDHMPLIGSLNL